MCSVDDPRSPRLSRYSRENAVTKSTLEFQKGKTMFNRKLFSLICAMALVKAGFAAEPILRQCNVQDNIVYTNHGSAAKDLNVQFKSCPSAKCDLVVKTGEGKIVDSQSDAVGAGQVEAFTFNIPVHGTLRVTCISPKKEEACQISIL